MSDLLGLDYEFPERVWVALGEGGLTCGTLQGEDFLYAAETEDDLREGIYATRAFLENVPLLETYRPMPLEVLMSILSEDNCNGRLVQGIAIFGPDGLEKARRYLP